MRSPQGGDAIPTSASSQTTLTCGIIPAVDTPELHDAESGDRVEQPGSAYWVGLRGRLARPFWGWLGSWTVLCGALASNHLHWRGEALLNLILVLLLVELAWGSLWDLAVGTGWLRSLTRGPATWRPASLPSLPYTQPHSPGGRLDRGLSRFVGWWRGAFWPSAGPALLALLAAAILTAALAWLLPARLRPLYAMLVALIGLGVVQRYHGRGPLAAHALLRVGLSWLVGHAAFASVGTASLLLALSFSLAAWGNLRVAARLPRGLWLLDAGQAFAAVILVVLRQPLAAGVSGLLLFGQIAMQPSLRQDGQVATSEGRDHLYGTVARRTWPWLMTAMILAAWALP